MVTAEPDANARLTAMRGHHTTAISPVLVAGLCHVLVGCAKGNGAPHEPSVFTGKNGQGAAMALKEYVTRFVKYCVAQEEDLLTAVILMDRASYAHRECTLSRNTIHRLFLAAMVVALKHRQDYYHPQSYYASVGGVGVDELNALERVFLARIDWDLHVEADLYRQYCVAVLGFYPFHGSLDGHIHVAAPWSSGAPPALASPDMVPSSACTTAASDSSDSLPAAGGGEPTPSPKRKRRQRHRRGGQQGHPAVPGGEATSWGAWKVWCRR